LRLARLAEGVGYREGNGGATSLMHFHDADVGGAELFQAGLAVNPQIKQVVVAGRAKQDKQVA
jgi:hypothetical protein